MPREHFTLCFSGGGFRAMLFHLGVVRALRDVGHLEDMKNIFSVSGGSILAAHLVLNWERYNDNDEDTFRTCARELIELAQSDMRGRILRRWLLFGWLRAVFDRTRQLSRHYDVLYRGAVLDGLSAPHRPALHIMATNMVSGEACFFTHLGIVRIADDQLLPLLPAAAVRVADAVAASSAFPPMFPPLTLTAKQLGFTGAEAPGVLRFTDGGVFDNTGVRAARCVIPGQTLLISDASASFDQATDQPFRGVLARTIRTTDILMGRVARLEEHQVEQVGTVAAAGRTITGRIASFVEAPDVARVNASPPLRLQSRAFQEWIKNVRTDLDYFADDVVRAIYRHGYEVGLHMASQRRPSEQLIVTKVYWDPCSRSTETEDRRAASEKRIERSPGTRSRMMFRGGTENVPGSIDTHALAMLKRSSNRKSGLWNARDGLCWVVAFALTACAILGTWMYWGSRLSDGLGSQPWKVVDIGGSSDDPVKKRLEEAGLSHMIRVLTDEAHAYRMQAGLKDPVVVMMAYSPAFAGRTEKRQVCSGTSDFTYKTFASGALLIVDGGVTYARFVPVERTKADTFRLDLPNSPKGSILTLVLAAVGKEANADRSRLASSLTEWRACDDLGK